MISRPYLACLLTLAALGLAPGAAHVMELPVKMVYPPALYAEVTRSLYRFYGIAGSAVQVAACLGALVLAWRLRRSPGAAMATASAAALVVSLVLWTALVAPVNAAWGALGEASAADVVAAYAASRARWEYGHEAAFAAWLAGWCGLAWLATAGPAPHAAAAR